jgi:hypothetical protein
MSPARHLGGCHCGRVRFAATFDPDAEVALDCDCSICRKKGFLHLIIPPDRFELLIGEGALRTYAFGTGAARHHFCETCGVHPFYRPRSHPHAFDVNVRCLDDRAVAARIAVEPFDGQDWEASVAARFGG